MFHALEIIMWNRASYLYKIVAIEMFYINQIYLCAIDECVGKL